VFKEVLKKEFKNTLSRIEKHKCTLKKKKIELKYMLYTKLRCSWMFSERKIEMLPKKLCWVFLT